MKAFSPAELFRSASICVAMILVAGCACHEQCPPQFSYHYTDSAHGFSICLPAGVTQGNAGGFPSGTVLFTGFPVPSGTNLDQKRLAIVPGSDPDLQDATPDGNFTVDGVTFRRATAGEGSAGHLDQYIVYTWKHGGKKLHFDFDLHSANVNDYPPSSRPAQFDYAAQVQSTEEIMRTFRLLH